MANFNSAYDIIKVHEGGYVSKATAEKIKDSGGETYKGIARNYNPAWKGWSIVDAYKAKNGIPKHGSYITSPELDFLVKGLAKVNYWDVVKLDNIKDQGVSNLMMDIAFNSGPSISAKSVQRVLKLTADGKVGPITIEAINKANPTTLLKDLVNYRTSWLTQVLKDKPQKVVAVLVARAQSYLVENANVAKGVSGVALLVGLGVAVFF